MAGIKFDTAETTKLIHVENLPTADQAQGLTVTQVIEGLKATISGKNPAGDPNGASIEFSSKQKHGYTIFTVKPTLTQDQFSKLDGDRNGAYLVTVNTHQDSTYTPAYKILFQKSETSVTAKFVESTKKNGDYSTKQPETQPQQ